MSGKGLSMHPWQASFQWNERLYRLYLAIHEDFESCWSACCRCLPLIKDLVLDTGQSAALFLLLVRLDLGQNLVMRLYSLF